MFYLPMLGNVIAFQDYAIHKGFVHSPWVGLKHFEDFFSNPFTVNLIRNTLAMSVMALLFGTTAAVSFAVLLNELRLLWIKRTVQTISYLPYFVSMAVAANIFIDLLSPGGPLNTMFHRLGLAGEPVYFLGKESWYWVILTMQTIWKNVGWNAIIYIAAIAGISPELFEAAQLDGANRWKKIRHVTIPCIMPTVVVLLIMNSGQLIMGGFEQQLLMYNPQIMDVGEVIQTYVYKRGLQGGEYSFATAVGMFQSLVSILIVVFMNRLAKKHTGMSLW